MQRNTLLGSLWESGGLPQAGPKQTNLGPKSNLGIERETRIISTPPSCGANWPVWTKSEHQGLITHSRFLKPNHNQP